METLIVIDHSPYSTWLGRDSLDVGFALAAFDQSVSLLFTGAGVYWLLQDQHGEAVSQKTLTKQLAAVGLFGIEALLVDEQACNEAGLAEADLVSDIRMVQESPELYRRYQHIIAL